MNEDAKRLIVVDNYAVDVTVAKGKIIFQVQPFPPETIVSNLLDAMGIKGYHNSGHFSGPVTEDREQFAYAMREALTRGELPANVGYVPGKLVEIGSVEADQVRIATVIYRDKHGTEQSETVLVFETAMQICRGVANAYAEMCLGHRLVKVDIARNRRDLARYLFQQKKFITDFPAPYGSGVNLFAEVNMAEPASQVLESPESEPSETLEASLDETTQAQKSEHTPVMVPDKSETTSPIFEDAEKQSSNIGVGQPVEDSDATSTTAVASKPTEVSAQAQPIPSEPSTDSLTSENDTITAPTQAETAQFPTRAFQLLDAYIGGLEKQLQRGLELYRGFVSTATGTIRCITVEKGQRHEHLVSIRDCPNGDTDAVPEVELDLMLWSEFEECVLIRAKLTPELAIQYGCDQWLFSRFDTKNPAKSEDHTDIAVKWMADHFSDGATIYDAPSYSIDYVHTFYSTEPIRLTRFRLLKKSHGIYQFKAVLEANEAAAQEFAESVSALKWKKTYRSNQEAFSGGLIQLIEHFEQEIRSISDSESGRELATGYESCIDDFESSAKSKGIDLLSTRTAHQLRGYLFRQLNWVVRGFQPAFDVADAARFPEQEGAWQDGNTSISAKVTYSGKGMASINLILQSPSRSELKLKISLSFTDRTGFISSTGDSQNEGYCHTEQVVRDACTAFLELYKLGGRLELKAIKPKPVPANPVPLPAFAQKKTRSPRSGQEAAPNKQLLAHLQQKPSEPKITPPVLDPKPILLDLPPLEGFKAEIVIVPRAPGKFTTTARVIATNTIEDGNGWSTVASTHPSKDQAIQAGIEGLSSGLLEQYQWFANPSVEQFEAFSCALFQLSQFAHDHEMELNATLHFEHPNDKAAESHRSGIEEITKLLDDGKAGQAASALKKQLAKLQPATAPDVIRELIALSFHYGINAMLCKHERFSLTEWFASSPLSRSGYQNLWPLLPNSIKITEAVSTIEWNPNPHDPGLTQVLCPLIEPRQPGYAYQDLAVWFDGHGVQASTGTVFLHLYAPDSQEAFAHRLNGLGWRSEFDYAIQPFLRNLNQQVLQKTAGYLRSNRWVDLERGLPKAGTIITSAPLEKLLGFIAASDAVNGAGRHRVAVLRTHGMYYAYRIHELRAALTAVAKVGTQVAALHLGAPDAATLICAFGELRSALHHRANYAVLLPFHRVEGGEADDQSFYAGRIALDLDTGEVHTVGADWDAPAQWQLDGKNRPDISASQLAKEAHRPFFWRRILHHYQSGEIEQCAAWVANTIRGIASEVDELTVYYFISALNLPKLKPQIPGFVIEHFSKALSGSQIREQLKANLWDWIPSDIKCQSPVRYSAIDTTQLPAVLKTPQNQDSYIHQPLHPSHAPSVSVEALSQFACAMANAHLYAVGGVCFLKQGNHLLAIGPTELLFVTQPLIAHGINEVQAWTIHQNNKLLIGLVDHSGDEPEPLRAAVLSTRPYALNEPNIGLLYFDLDTGKAETFGVSDSLTRHCFLTGQAPPIGLIESYLLNAEWKMDYHDEGRNHITLHQATYCQNRLGIAVWECLSRFPVQTATELIIALVGEFQMRAKGTPQIELTNEHRWEQQWTMLKNRWLDLQHQYSRSNRQTELYESAIEKIRAASQQIELDNALAQVFDRTSQRGGKDVIVTGRQFSLAGFSHVFPWSLKQLSLEDQQQLVADIARDFGYHQSLDEFSQATILRANSKEARAQAIIFRYVEHLRKKYDHQPPIKGMVFSGGVAEKIVAGVSLRLLEIRKAEEGKPKVILADLHDAYWRETDKDISTRVRVAGVDYHIERLNNALSQAANKVDLTALERIAFDLDGALKPQTTTRINPFRSYQKSIQDQSQTAKRSKLWEYVSARIGTARSEPEQLEKVLAYLITKLTIDSEELVTMMPLETNYGSAAS